MLSLSRNEAVPLKTMRAGMPWDWETFPEFLDSVDRTPKGVNVMSLVPLAPLYGYVIGVDKAKEQRASDEELDQMCQLLVEAMEAGGCGWSSQISGDVGNVQRDYDGTPMVTDCMTEREIVAFSRALRKLGRGTTQITGPLDTAALIARESGRPIIWNALAPTGAVNQHGEFRYPHRETIARLDQLNQEEGVRVFASAQIVRFKSEINFEDYNLMDIFPAWQEATLGTLEEKIGKLSDPERRPKLKEAIDTLGGGFGAARYPLAEITVNWISSDAPNAQELKESYEGYTIGEIAAREGKHLLDAMLDIAVAARLNAGFGTTMIDMDPQAVKEVGTSSVALPGHQRRRRPHQVRHHRPLRHRGARPLGPRARAHVRRGGASGGSPATRRMAIGLRDRGTLAEGRPADVIVYDPDTVDALPSGALVRLPSRRVAAGAEGHRLRAHHRERRDDVHRRRVHRRDPRAPAPPRHRLRRRRAATCRTPTIRSRRSSTPTTTTGRPASPSPATATRSSPTGA